ncbi:hypothetical protein CPLU01_09494 [Colletotrichum plurivorum]|uniref:Ubiquitin-like domain-containing protein n=1 Tax=Colletotrichum plurivorum TaxID=2175906 RepID=A0A8H6K8L5_9PEZI|nr:hypothetical protein CPLU01_09494 [Colletotrichum plurivorum]
MTDHEAPALKDEPQIQDVRRGESSNAMSAPAPQEGSAAPEASPNTAGICAIADIKLEKDTEVWAQDGKKAVIAIQEPTPDATTPPVEVVSSDDEAVHEAKDAGGALGPTSSAQKEGTPGVNPSEKTDASEAPATPGVQPHRAPVMGEPGWEKAPDRPPQKLPIRLKDCIGRDFMIPWKVAKSWSGMKNLIRSSFMQFDVLSPHVAAGRYDLFFHKAWLTADSGAVSPELMSFHHVAGSSVGGPATASPAPGTVDPSSALGAWCNSCIILPELWEDIVEPGMLVTMHMWPISVPVPFPVPPPAPEATLLPPPPGCPFPSPRRKTRRKQG